MEPDRQLLCSSPVPVISRLERLESLVQQLEKKPRLSEHLSTLIPAEGGPDDQCKRLSSALEEVQFKGTVMERIAMLENRVLQLCLAVEDEKTSSSNTWTKPESEVTTHILHVDWDGNTSSSSASTKPEEHKLNVPSQWDGNLPSSSNPAQPEIENINQNSPAEWDEKSINSLENQERITIQVYNTFVENGKSCQTNISERIHTGNIQEKVYEQSWESDNKDQKKSRRYKKPPSFNRDKTRFGWFHMGC